MNEDTTKERLDELRKLSKHVDNYRLYFSKALAPSALQDSIKINTGRYNFFVTPVLPPSLKSVAKSLLNSL